MSTVSVEDLRTFLSTTDSSLDALQDTPESLKNLIHQFPFKGDPNRSFQYCLIHGLSNENKPNTLKALAPYWNNRDRLINGHSIQEIEQSVGITDTKPFVPSDYNFRKLETMLGIGINCYMVVNDDQSDSTDPQSSAGESSNEPCPIQTVYVSQYSKEERIILNLCVVYIPSKNSVRYFVVNRVDGFLRNRPVPVETKMVLCNCDYCGYCTTSKERMTLHKRMAHCSIVNKNDESLSRRDSVKQPHFTDIPKMMRAPVVVYADYVCCQKENGAHKPVALTFVTVSRIPSIPSEDRTFYASNESYKDFIPAAKYLEDLFSRVNEYCHTETKRTSNTRADTLKKQQAQVCPFCNTRMIYGRKQNNKVFHHAHVAGDYYNGKEWVSLKAGDDVCVCCGKCNTKLEYKKHLRIPVIFNSENNGYSVFLQALGEYEASLHNTVSITSTSMDPRKKLKLSSIQLRESCQMIDMPLSEMVVSILGNQNGEKSFTTLILQHFFSCRHLSVNVKHIQTLLNHLPSIVFKGPSAQVLEIATVPQRGYLFDSRTKQEISEEEHKMVCTIWNAYCIANWKDHITLRSLMNATLLGDCMEVLRSRFDSFGVDYANYSSLSSLSYSLFLKTGFSHNKSRFVDLGKAWESELFEREVKLQAGYLASNYEQSMEAFYNNEGIRLLENMKNDPWGIIPMLRADVTAFDQLQDSQLKGRLYDRMEVALLFPMPFEVIPKDEKELFSKNAEEMIQNIDIYGSRGYFFEVVLTIPESLQTRSTYYSQLDVTTRLLDYRLLQRYLRDGCTITSVLHAIPFSQAPFFYEYFFQLKQSKDQYKEEWYTRVVDNMMTEKLLKELYEVAMKTSLPLTPSNSATDSYTDEKLDSIVNKELFVPSVQLGKPKCKTVTFLKPFFIAKSLIDVSISLLLPTDLNIVPPKVVPKPARPIPAKPVIDKATPARQVDFNTSAEVTAQPSF